MWSSGCIWAAKFYGEFCIQIKTNLFSLPWLLALLGLLQNQCSWVDLLLQQGVKFGYTAWALDTAGCGNSQGTQMISDHQTMNKWGLAIKVHHAWSV